MKLLLCTDMDRTLIPNGFDVESPNARQCFKTLVERPEVQLVYVTGRDRNLVEEAIDKYSLPEPDYVIADVGSTIYRIDNNSWIRWSSWEKEIGPDWNGRSPEEIHQLIRSFEELRRQESNKQNRFKLSYYVSLHCETDQLISNIKQKLEAHNIFVSIIWSIDELANTGLLDILPLSANKRHAIEFLMQEKSYSFEEVIFAGDSGNDISVMVSPLRSVLVANATEEVKLQALNLAINNNEEKSFYQACGNIYSMNGNYAAGIIEGVLHYYPEAELWLGKCYE